MKTLLSAVLAVASLSPVQQRPQTFTGVVTDEMCAGVGHASMRMDPSDAECARLCVVSHGALWVLESGKDIYILSDQTAPERLAAKRVRVTGTLDARTKTLTVRSIEAL